MTINHIDLGSHDPPATVENDIEALDGTIAVESLELQNSPDDAWTIRITDETDRESFDAIVDLIEGVVSTGNISTFYDLDGKANWLIQIQYEAN